MMSTSSTTRFRGITLAAAAILATAYEPSAYTLKTAKWNTSAVPFYVNAQNFDTDPAAIAAAVQFGASAWTTQSNAAFSFYYAGGTNGSTVTNNGKNEVFFRNATNGNAIATTYTYSSGGRILDTDIVFWDAAFKFFTGTSGCSGGFYVEDIATHEFGHALGLGHSSVSGATMYPSISYCSSNARWLADDDRQGVEALYPSAAANTQPQVQISSPSTGTSFEEGTAIRMTGTAADAEDGNLASSIAWKSSRDGALGTGSSIERVLSAGAHTITASVADAGGAIAEAYIGVTVEPPVTATTTEGIALSANRYKVKGLQHVDLSWTGATSSAVDVYRDGKRITTSANTGSYTDALNRKGGGTYSYVVCEAGTATCSNTISVTF